MFQFTEAQIIQWIGGFIWPLARILAMFAADPLFSMRVVPVRIKVGLGISLSAVLIGVLPPPPMIPIFSAGGFLILLQQILIGVLLGLTTRIIFTAVEFAGNIASLQMGLGFASFFNPQQNSQSPIVSHFLGIFTLLVYLAMNGHLVALYTLKQSFYVFPITPDPMKVIGLKVLFEWSAQIFSLGMMLCLPVIAALLVTNLAIGVMTRAAPQLNIFSVGFPLTIAVGFAALYFSLPYFLPIFERTFDMTSTVSLNLMKALSPVPAFPTR